jgi:hypothetical protein
MFWKLKVLADDVEDVLRGLLALTSRSVCSPDARRLTSNAERQPVLALTSRETGKETWRETSFLSKYVKGRS